MPPKPQSSSPHQAIWIGVALLAITAGVFASVRGFDFVSWDDPWYVSNNPHVAGGLTWASVAWAFTSGGEFYWHPLTWLSHMLDVSLYGMNAGGHHVTSALLHLANTLLLFALLRQMTGATWRSGLVAALFAVHPLHVESVAWVAERKDVLSTFFWMLTLAAYVWYVRRPGWRRYLAVAGAFSLGLMAKPMIVTLPVVLLLLDVWPLGRWPAGPPRTGSAAGERPPGRTAILRLVWEKVPLFALAVASSVGTFIVQQQVGAVAGLDVLPVQVRVANAVVSYGAYLYMTVVPVNLAAFYPYPPGLPSWWLVGLTAIGLTVVVLAAVRMVRTRPYLIVGVLWYLITLFPVIGVFQAGDQLMADRFTYVPLIGVFVIAAWGIAELTVWRPRLRTVIAAASGAAVIACAVGAHAQVRYWKNTESLWVRALAVTTGNHRAHAALGDWLAAQGKTDEAIGHYREAVRFAPAGPDYHYGLGLALLRLGRLDEAVRACGQAARLDTRLADARQCQGLALTRLGRFDEAAVAFAEAVRLDPRSEAAHVNLGVALGKAGRTAEAVKAFEEALRINPANEAVRQAASELRGRGR
jgi:protein O-mannosyl-transferase